MLDECLEYLAIRPDGTYLDATAGLGGHTAAMAQRLSAGIAIASDQDAESLEMARKNTDPWKDRIRYCQGTFSQLRSRLTELGIEKVDGLLADLGSSSYQLNDAERGFSLQADGPLDMRMDRSRGGTAADLVNFTSEKDLADLIYLYGEERRSRRIARAIVRARPIHSTMQLALVVEKAAPRMGRLHPATQTFMALRRKVNEEEEELEALLSAIPELVKSGGRVVILTFMSLEDRLVKRSFQELARAGRATLLTKHVVRPTDEEIKRNPPSRSAKLRALEMS
jgi:16S rRNA (cytosine1402-N4)-methyltransferase